MVWDGLGLSAPMNADKIKTAARHTRIRPYSPANDPKLTILKLAGNVFINYNSILQNLTRFMYRNRIFTV